MILFLTKVFYFCLLYIQLESINKEAEEEEEVKCQILDFLLGRANVCGVKVDWLDEIYICAKLCGHS